MLGGTLSTSPAQFTTIVGSMFVNKTKTTLRAHTVDKNTSSVCRSKRRFRPKPHAPVLFLSIYRDTVPLIDRKILKLNIIFIIIIILMMKKSQEFPVFVGRRKWTSST